MASCCTSLGPELYRQLASLNKNRQDFQPHKDEEKCENPNSKMDSDHWRGSSKGCLRQWGGVWSLRIGHRSWHHSRWCSLIVADWLGEVRRFIQLANILHHESADGETSEQCPKIWWSSAVYQRQKKNVNHLEEVLNQRQAAVEKKFIVMWPSSCSGNITATV